MDDHPNESGAVATWLTDEQYELLFGESPPASNDIPPAVSAARSGFVERPTTRWDRRQPVTDTADGQRLQPPAIPTLDLRSDDDRIELDIFGEDRLERSLDVVGSIRPQLTIQPAVFDEPVDTEVLRESRRSRAVGLAFAFAALAATIALWMVAVTLYY